MSKNNDKSIQNVTVKQAFDNLDKWCMVAPRINNFTKKQECPVLYNGKEACVQFGTPNNPVHCPFGASYWDNQQRTYVNVKNAFETNWAYAAAAASQFENKKPGGKLEVQLTAYDHNTEGTQGFYIYGFINGLLDRIVQGLVHGVPDYSNMDANGNPKIVQALSATGLPEEPGQREALFRQLINSPIKHDNPQYSPGIKCKVRYGLRTDANGTARIVLTQTKIFDRSTEKLLSDPMTGKEKKVYEEAKNGREFELLKPKARGVWMVKINPVTFPKKNEINVTIDIVKTVINPYVYKSAYEDTEFVDEEGDAEMSNIEIADDD